MLKDIKNIMKRPLCQSPSAELLNPCNGEKHEIKSARVSVSNFSNYFHINYIQLFQ